MEVAGARERAKIVKAVVDKAVQQNFNSHANVQLQGSTGKHTNTAKSDVDLFVRMDPNLPHVARKERAIVAACIEHGLRDQHIDPADAKVRIAKTIIQVRPAAAASGIPKTDIVFERCKGVSKPPDEPNRGMPTLAAQAVRHVKGLGAVGGYSNLPSPAAAHHLERYAVLKHDELRCQHGHGKDDMTGRDGFSRLVPAMLAGIAGNQPVTKQQEAALKAAGVHGNPEYDRVAARELKNMSLKR
ncbi:hypothetical protein FOA52_005400 [Chlamydomonas sp. UWO 241]|nr:hypothetical protein FOA52_005400 [Chlamydomonas sp. UWO 241]